MNSSKIRGDWNAKRDAKRYPITKKVQEALCKARKYSPEAVELLHDIMTDKRIAPRTRLTAIGMMLDRAMGRAPQAVWVDEPKQAMEDMTPAERIKVLKEAIAEQEELAEANRMDESPLDSIKMTGT